MWPNLFNNKKYTRLKLKRKEKWLSEGNLTYRCITYRCHSLAFQQYMRLAILTLCQCSKNGPDQKVQPETNQYADWLNFIWTAGQSKWVLWFTVGSTDFLFYFLILFCFFVFFWVELQHLSSSAWQSKVYTLIKHHWIYQKVWSQQSSTHVSTNSVKVSTRLVTDLKTNSFKSETDRFASQLKNARWTWGIGWF
jgi:hypothetical protein